MELKECSPLWEESVPLMKEGLHKVLRKRAYATSTLDCPVFPLKKDVFAAMRLTSLSSTKVVIIGQDPYFNEYPGIGPEAHGLCFSVPHGVPVPPSLRNIFKEINDSLYNGKEVSSDTDLTRLAKQGVLLLNASLTVKKKRPNSHVSLGWHKLTDNIIETISDKKEGVVFMLWGAFARKKASLIDKNKHLILETTHPSPLSAHRGFLGSGVFVKCNNYLKENGKKEIIW